MESKPDSLSLFPRSSYFADGCDCGRILPHRGINKISCDQKCKQDNQDKEAVEKHRGF